MSKRVLNLTPHDVSIVDKEGLVIATYPTQKVYIRSRQELGPELESVDGVSPVYGVGTYSVNREEFEMIGLNKGDTIIVSSISAEHIKELAQAADIRVLVPATGPDQCHRENG